MEEYFFLSKYDLKNVRVFSNLMGWRFFFYQQIDVTWFISFYERMVVASYTAV